MGGARSKNEMYAELGKRFAKAPRDNAVEIPPSPRSVAIKNLWLRGFSVARVQRAVLKQAAKGQTYTEINIDLFVLNKFQKEAVKSIVQEAVGDCFETVSCYRDGVRIEIKPR